MKKRIISIILCILLVFQITHYALADSLSNFTATRTYTTETFSDVKSNDWFYANVRTCYELALIDGSDGKYNPSGNLTLAEAIKLAANLRSIYETGKPVVQTGEVWYNAFVNYCISKEIIKADTYPNYTARATRADFVQILAAALPDEATTPANEVPDGAIPDVSESYSYGAAVYKFYRAGILTGSGTDGAFKPNNPISRAETAAVISRIARPEQRVVISTVSTITAEEVYAKCSPAVFFIEVKNKDGEPVKFGSGFFITSSGVAVTNAHVIADAQYATATLSTGEEFKIKGIYGYDIKTDCAIIQVEGNNFPTLSIGDYTPKTGAEIYTIGNPNGLANTFSRGIISTAARVVDDVTYIQFDASISSGSSGGALLDASGRVIGITAASFTSGQSLNLAIPIGNINSISRTTLYNLGTHPSGIKFYEGLFPAPDFGAYSGLTASDEEWAVLYSGYLNLMISYDITDKNKDTLLSGYIKLLTDLGFTAYYDEDDYFIYYNETFDIVMYIYLNTFRGRTYIDLDIF